MKTSTKAQTITSFQTKPTFSQGKGRFMKKVALTISVVVFLIGLTSITQANGEPSLANTDSALTWLVLTKALESGIAFEDMQLAQAAPGHPLNDMKALTTEALSVEYNRLMLASYQRDVALGAQQPLPFYNGMIRDIAAHEAGQRLAEYQRNQALGVDELLPLEDE